MGEVMNTYHVHGHDRYGLVVVEADRYENEVAGSTYEFFAGDERIATFNKSSVYSIVKVQKGDVK